MARRRPTNGFRFCEGRARRRVCVLSVPCKSGRRVPHEPARGDGVTENQGGDAPYPMGLVNSAANFNFAKDGKQFWWSDLRNGAIA